jgi:SAM-dependent methyltransferase
MPNDILDLREFYVSPLGRVVRSVLRQKLRDIWGDIRGEVVVAYGYATPFLRPFLGEPNRLLALMPAMQGVAFWPREGPNISVLVEEGAWPLPDHSAQKIVMAHALETSSHQTLLLNECWRTLAPGGRLYIIVPNRMGLWARSESTPFGMGQPYSVQQMRFLLKDHGFVPERIFRALYMPPTQSRTIHRLAAFLEKHGETIMPSFSGVIVVEAVKQLYAPLSTKSRELSVPLKLSMPATAQPFPTTRELG